MTLLFFFLSHVSEVNVVWVHCAGFRRLIFVVVVRVSGAFTLLKAFCRGTSALLLCSERETLLIHRGEKERKKEREREREEESQRPLIKK